jgi:hypothetical protein
MRGRASFLGTIYARLAAGIGSADGHAGQGPGDDQSLDLARALEDRVDLGVPVRDLRPLSVPPALTGIGAALRRVAWVFLRVPSA